MSEARGGAGPAPEREVMPPRWVHYLAVVTASLTFVLICAGGLVKSLKAGLSVPDWPLSYGQPQQGIVLSLFGGTIFLALAWVIFRKKALAVCAILCGAGLASTYYFFGPMPGWIRVPNVSAEHGHRLLAGTVGFLTAILAGALWATDRRRWVRRLSLASLVAVAVQAVLGGITVHYLLPPLVSASHGSLAQAFFAMLVTLAVATAPGWFEDRPPIPQTDRKPLQRLSIMMVAALYLQVMLGSAVRHTEYYPEYSNSSATFAWHLGAHLAGLLWVGHTFGAVLVRVIRRHGEETSLMRPASLLTMLFGAQILLGIGALFIRLTETEYDPSALKLLVRTAHVAGGALSLVTAVWIMLVAHRRLAPAVPQGESSGKDAKSQLAQTGTAT